MPFRLAHVDGETSVTRKLIAKAVSFLAETNKRGEMHEIKTLFEAQDGRLVLDDGGVCSLPTVNGQQYFTRMVWPCRKLGDVTVSSLQRLLCLDKNSMVLAGSHEVDALLEHAPGGHAKVLLECKSGDAHSTGAQTNAYLECLLEESRLGRTHHYFASAPRNRVRCTFQIIGHSFCACSGESLKSAPYRERQELLPRRALSFHS